MSLIHAPKARHAFLILGHGPIWQYASIDFTYYETILHQVWLWTVSHDFFFFFCTLILQNMFRYTLIEWTLSLKLQEPIEP